jgi:hypothetical protein
MQQALVDVRAVLPGVTSLDLEEPDLGLGAQIELMAPPSTGIIAPVI